VRGAFPDLPSSQQLTQVVRSPLAFLDDLADKHAASQAQEASGAGDGGSDPPVAGAPSRPSVQRSPERAAERVGWEPVGTDGVDDPSMN